MKPTPKTESLDSLLNCLTWYYSGKEISKEELEKFMKAIALDEPDAGIVSEVYEKYSAAIHDNGTKLAAKWLE